ncbi:MAG: wax ester/triacylglycerol synthase family O-acyltransferase [Acidobacteria bacterium]|nr:wax ester/triacylglycerol synthase family O-acyltransferase [Acidobacteriota bacterium]
MNMNDLKPAGVVGQGFLWSEARLHPMHISGLWILRPPAGEEREWSHRLFESFSRYREAVPPFNLRPSLRMGLWFWEADPGFEIRAHLREHSLPPKGRERDLRAMVSRLHAKPLDMERALWEQHIIHGLAGGRAAIFTKMHHALVDGVAAIRMVRRQMSESARDRSPVPIWAMPRHASRPGRIAGGILARIAETATIVRDQLATVPTLVREMAHSVAMLRGEDGHVFPFEAPHTIFNQPIGKNRKLILKDWPLSRLQVVAHLHGATVNEIVLGMCGGALRRYLLELKALPARPLIAMVPVSLRRDESEGGNQVALFLANLGTHVADPVERLGLVVRSGRATRDRFARMTQDEIINFVATALALPGVNMLTRVFPEHLPFNVVVSNVSGPKRPLFLAGARLEGLYPCSIVSDSIALNITLQSYDEKVGFGIVACPDTVPGLNRLVTHLEAGLSELEKAGGAR